MKQCDENLFFQKRGNYPSNTTRRKNPYGLNSSIEGSLCLSPSSNTLYSHNTHKFYCLHAHLVSLYTLETCTVTCSLLWKGGAGFEPQTNLDSRSIYPHRKEKETTIYRFTTYKYNQQTFILNIKSSHPT